MRQLVSQASRLSQSEGLRQSLITVVGNFGATGVSAVALILISRLLGPVQFSEFSVGFAVLLILNRINDVGLNAAVLKFAGGTQDKPTITRIVGYTTKIKALVSVALVSGCLLLTPALVKFLNFQQPVILYAAVVLSLFSTWYEHLLAVLQATHRFTAAVVANLLQSSTKLVVVVLLWGLGLSSSITIFVSYMVAPVIPVMLFRWLTPSWLKVSLPKQNITEHSALWAMARHSAVGFIAAGMIENIDILFVQRYLSPFETGLMGGVSRIAMMILLVAYSLGNVLYPRVARYQQVTHMRKYIRKAMAMIVVALIGYLVFIPFGELSILLTIGSDYVAGVDILYILVAASFLTVATIPFQALFYSFKADWYFSLSGIAQLLIIIIGNWWFVPEYGLEAAAWTRLASRLLLFVMTFSTGMWLYYQHYVQKNPKQALR
jgi:O-antigen/teichoic acid export membrane protein